ncbi:hypothetical protein ACVMB3_007101 [Sinorhizobium meliloti]
MTLSLITVTEAKTYERSRYPISLLAHDPGLFPTATRETRGLGPYLRNVIVCTPIARVHLVRSERWAEMQIST